MTAPALPDDHRDLLRELQEAGVRFLVVGAHALAVHGVPRATGDLDLFVSRDPANAQRLMLALGRFGAPVAAHGLSAADFERLETVYQLGLPPLRIDLMTSLTGVEFGEAERAAVTAEIDGLRLPVLGRRHLIVNKRATGRAKDLLDAQLLEERDSTEAPDS